MWYVYFIKLDNNDIYVGSTGNLRARLQAHHNGEVRSTKSHRPIVLKSFAAVETEAQARQLEIYFKTGSGKAIALRRFLHATKSEESQKG